MKGYWFIENCKYAPEKKACLARPNLLLSIRANLDNDAHVEIVTFTR